MNWFLFFSLNEKVFAWVRHSMVELFGLLSVRSIRDLLLSLLAFVSSPVSAEDEHRGGFNRLSSDMSSSSLDSSLFGLRSNVCTKLGASNTKSLRRRLTKNSLKLFKRFRTAIPRTYLLALRATPSLQVLLVLGIDAQNAVHLTMRMTMTTTLDKQCNR